MPFVDGLKIGTITKLLSVTGIVFVVEFDLKIVDVLKIVFFFYSTGFSGRNADYYVCTCSLCRCQIAVHQECYGVKSVQDFTSWVCRVCETPDVERECCLCPVKGMLSNFSIMSSLTWLCCFPYTIFCILGSSL